jgi:hypothetical protein
VSDPDPRPGERPEDTSPDALVRMLGRVVRTFLVPFLSSWFLSYVGGQLGYEWLYYAGLTGVGLSVIGLLLWLLHH